MKNLLLILFIFFGESVLFGGNPKEALQPKKPPRFLLHESGHFNPEFIIFPSISIVRVDNRSNNIVSFGYKIPPLPDISVPQSNRIHFSEVSVGRGEHNLSVPFILNTGFPFGECKCSSGQESHIFFNNSIETEITALLKREPARNSFILKVCVEELQSLRSDIIFISELPFEMAPILRLSLNISETGMVSMSLVS